jgi:thiamine transporter
MAAMGLGGIFSKHKLLSSLIAGSLRLFCHTLAGVIFFASYAPIGENVWIYSLIYNATFLVPSLALSAFIALILWRKLNQVGV